MYKKVSTNLNFVEREKETAQFWKDHDIFKKSIETREGDPVYTFYDGPPTANGKPHIGHVLTRVIKDMIPRYRTMKGYMVPRKAGSVQRNLANATQNLSLMQCPARRLAKCLSKTESCTSTQPQAHNLSM